MSAPVDDARLRELALLSELARSRSKDIPGLSPGDPMRDMVVSLIVDGFVNDLASVPWSVGQSMEQALATSPNPDNNMLNRRFKTQK